MKIWQWMGVVALVGLALVLAMYGHHEGMREAMGGLLGLAGGAFLMVILVHLPSER